MLKRPTVIAALVSLIVSSVIAATYQLGRHTGYRFGYAMAQVDARYVPSRMEQVGFCPSYRPKEGDEWTRGCKP